MCGKSRSSSNDKLLIQENLHDPLFNQHQSHSYLPIYVYENEDQQSGKNKPRGQEKQFRLLSAHKSSKEQKKLSSSQNRHRKQ